MNTITLYPENSKLMQDLALQIKQFLPETEISFDEPNEKTELLIVDENESYTKDISSKYNELSIVLLSSTQDMSEYADIVTLKPIKLYNFLKALQENTLLPEIRRKTCFNFQEYSFYPVKKEIFSSKNSTTIKLTEKEVSILKYLYEIAPEIASKEDLLENVWEYNPEATTHTVETHIYRLRQKVEIENGSQLIITENNGYKLNI